MKRTFTVIAVNFMVFCTLVVGLEILGQMVHLVNNGNLLFLKPATVHSRVFEIHPYLAGRPKSSIKVDNYSKIITTTAINTRWTGAEQDDSELIRIAVLGGSTAFGTGVSDEDTWPALLQAKLGKQYAVINYGVPGYTTAENIIQMALIVPEKRPHIVLFYEGWNDIRNYHEKELGPDYYGHGIRQYGGLGIPVFEQENKIQSLRNTFAIIRLIDRIKKATENHKEQTFESFDKPDQYVDKIYTRNLNTLKLLSENIGAFTVFVPQVLNYEDFSGKEESRVWTRHIKDDAMPILMDRFNSHMNGLCSEGEQRCAVLTEVLEENWIPDDFVDDGHLSKSGGLKFSQVVAQFIHSKSAGGFLANTTPDSYSVAAP